MRWRPVRGPVGFGGRREPDDTRARSGEGECVRRQVAGDAELGRAVPDDLHRAPHRSVRRDERRAVRPPAAEIAGRAELNERYVREWLGAMVTGGVVDYDPPRAPIACRRSTPRSLTRAAAPNNMAAFMQYIAVMGAVEDDIVDCFQQGRRRALLGVQALPRGDGGGQRPDRRCRRSPTTILPLVAGPAEALARRDRRARPRLRQRPGAQPHGARLPRSRFRGSTSRRRPIARRARRGGRRGLSNVRFDVGTPPRSTRSAAYDFITTFDAIHDQADPARVLRNIRRALRPRRDLPHAGHLGHEPPRGEHRAPARRRSSTRSRRCTA